MEFDFPGIVRAFLAPAAVAAAVSWIFQILAKGKVDSYFNQKLEQFKHDLGQAAAAAQFDYQRRLHDFEAFSEKRHAVYGEAFKRARAVLNTSIRYGYDAFNLRNDLVPDEGKPEYLELVLQHQKTEPEVIEIVREMGLFEQPPDQASTMMTMDQAAEVFKRLATEKRDAFEECVTDNSLFLSRRVSDASWNFIQDAYTYMDATFYGAEDSSFVKDRSDQLKKSLADVEAAMREELSVGYYEDRTPAATVSPPT